MASFEGTFQRKEMKYRLTRDQLERLLPLLEERLQPCEYGACSVTSLYFDTPAFEIIERSLDKPVYKEKLRLRIYGEPSAQAQAFIELKKKFKGIVYKRRVSLSLSAAEAYLDGVGYREACLAFPLIDQTAHEQSLSRKSLQIAREIDFFRSRWEQQSGAALRPSMLIRCNRLAFADPGGSDLRITFDSDIRGKADARSIYDQSDAESVTGIDEAIMELKSSAPLPLWLTQALSSIGAYRQSFSKYGSAYLGQGENRELAKAPPLPRLYDTSRRRRSAETRDPDPSQLRKEYRKREALHA